jgi:hypothetical protein
MSWRRPSGLAIITADDDDGPHPVLRYAVLGRVDDPVKSLVPVKRISSALAR